METPPFGNFFSSFPFPPFVLLSLPSLFPSLPFSLSFRHLSLSKIQDAHLKGSGGLPKFGRSGGLPCSEERENSKDSIGWASEERKTKKPRFDRVGFRRTENQETKIRKIGWASEERKTKKPRFVRSGGLPKNGKPRNQDSIGWASEERKTKKPRFVRSGGLPENENPKIRSGGLPKNENPKIRSGGLPKNENPKIKIRSGGLLCEKTKIRSGGVGFRPSGKESQVSRVSSEERKKPKIRSDGLLKNNQRFVYTNT
ncbi:hypothetical protein GLOIN_2v1775927 [Rhizophagus irregularis DAOM 181602=DAOM 197198]|nr:hypothetical protein GLOIN_2v1775927 [Rhizophagus irregularis DAOM 181602=DAOM 197198]